MSTPERIDNAELTARLLAQAQLTADPAATIPEVVARCVRLYGAAQSAGPVHTWVGVVLTYLGAHPVQTETERLIREACDLLDIGHVSRGECRKAPRYRPPHEPEPPLIGSVQVSAERSSLFPAGLCRPETRSCC